MTPSEYSKAVIATACYQAAPTELHQVMLYIAMVFRNRAEAGWFDGDIYTNAAIWLGENIGPFPDTRNPEFGQLLAKLEGVTSGLVPDKTGGALWFGPKTDDPVAGTITTSAGQTIFFK